MTSCHSNHSKTTTVSPSITESLPALHSGRTPEQDTEHGSGLGFESSSVHSSEHATEDGVLPPINQATIFTRLRYLPLSAGFLVGVDIASSSSAALLRAILFLYLVSFGLLSDTTARLIYHVFTALNFVAPIFGAWVADAKFGRYSVILALVLVYLLSLGLLTLAAGLSFLGPIFQLILSLVALCLAALGDGGLRPVVSSLGADQLRSPVQLLLLPFFFSVWYYATNIGSIIGALVSPALRNALGYPCTFLLSFVLLFIAFIVFLSGRKRYHRVPPSPTPPNFRFVCGLPVSGSEPVSSNTSSTPCVAKEFVCFGCRQGARTRSICTGGIIYWP